MTIESLKTYLQTYIEPLTDQKGNKIYRCSAILKDESFLPCVLIQSAEIRLQQALGKIYEIEESHKVKKVYDTLNDQAGQGLLDEYVNQGNRIQFSDIKSLAKSPNAIPLKFLKEIKGETRLGWTMFTAIMKDGESFVFGTSEGCLHFFCMPSGYCGDDVTMIIPHRGGGKHYPEAVYFNCYVYGILDELYYDENYPLPRF